jgi:hypothetical protein
VSERIIAENPCAYRIAYKVEVTRIEEHIFQDRDWEVLQDTGGGDGGKLYGHKETEVSIFEQRIDYLDLVAVIKAINGIQDEPQDEHGQQEEPGE